MRREPTVPMEVGKLYVIPDGHIIEYRGPNQGIGRLAFREVTTADARGLRVRLVALRARRMAEEAAWIREVMGRVGVEPSKIPARFTRGWAP